MLDRWKQKVMTLGLVSLGVLGAAGPALSQSAERLPTAMESCSLDTGLLAPSGTSGTSGKGQEVLFTTVVDRGPAASIRLEFAKVQLPSGARLRITGLKDGQVQMLDAEAARAWGNTSAYFNGGAVRVEVLADAGAAAARVELARCQVERHGARSDQPRTICGLGDDRVPSNNPAVGRLLVTTPAGTGVCTATIIQCPMGGSDKCHLTAGHCFENATSAVLEFEVPASNANCSLVRPVVVKQFSVLMGTVEREANGVGDDWAVFRAGRNSAGRTTFEEQGSALTLASAVPASGVVRETGFGADADGAGAGVGNSSCGTCDPADATGERNVVQQTHTGDLEAVGATHLEFDIDDCGGNSGSAVVLESSGEVIGIATHGGCGVVSGHNHGTRIDHPDLAAALQGCEPNLLVVLDRTGSMLAPRANGHSRCRDAQALARQDVVTFFLQHPMGTAAVWTFAHSSPTDLTGGFVNEAGALAALDGLDPEGCEGSTPLADALCGGAQELADRFPVSLPAERVLAVSSDGGENVSSGECAGPDSAAAIPPYTPGSWQAKVRDKLLGLNVTEVRFWGTVTRQPAVDPETGQVRAPAVADADFFSELAAATGGSYQGVDDGGTLPPPFFGPGGGPNVLDIPALDSLGLLALALGLLLAGGWVLRRR